LKEGEEDFIIMQINIEGIKNNSNVKYQFDLYDEYDKEKQTTSMARTTGYTATIIARQFLNGLIQQKGICPPENIGKIPGCYENLLEEYTKKNIEISMKKN
jgi:lysine 6-dehydrogenase